MFALLVIIAILLVLILAAIVPDFWELVFGLAGLLVGLAVLIVGGFFLIAFISDLLSSAPPSVDETRSTQPSSSYEIRLDDFLSFTDPANCGMSEKTQSIFDNMIIFDPPDYVGRRGPSIQVPGVGTATPAFTRSVKKGPNLDVRDNEATLAIRGYWHGLKVGSIRVRRMEESSFWEYQIRFSESPSRLRSRLNELGFNLPPVDEFREFRGADGRLTAIAVETIPEGAALYCGSSVFYG